MLEISNGARLALKLLHASGYEAYLVGGCVRDMVMGTRAHDYDITTSATPSQMKEGNQDTNRRNFKNYLNIHSISH